MSAALARGHVNFPTPQGLDGVRGGPRRHCDDDDHRSRSHRPGPVGPLSRSARRLAHLAAKKPLRIGKAYLLDEHVLPSVFIGGLGSDLDERVNAYLRTGRLPAHDPTCGAQL